MRPLYDLMIAAIEAGETENKFFAVVRASFRVFFSLGCVELRLRWPAQLAATTQGSSGSPCSAFSLPGYAERIVEVRLAKAEAR
ncbi:hypothetical protein HFO38_30520 [Rhizobium leguminosarum]|uniref:hypothetical protein n=1 Tax=Rhizobium leguminosarum TaxID=384 RepID=UPI001C98B2EC|nr:hypothetical protein [Rhizobium leguminosarum]MBY5706985.1 hypothetical protein [Rhizobium leguminosarum]